MLLFSVCHAKQINGMNKDELTEDFDTLECEGKNVNVRRYRIYATTSFYMYYNTSVRKVFHLVNSDI